MSEFKVSCVPIMWSSAEKDFKYEDILIQIGEIGYTGIEGIPADYKNHLNQFKKLLEKYNLKCAGSYFSGDFIYREKVDEEVEAAAELAQKIATLGGETMLVAGNMMPVNRRDKGLSLDQFKLFANTLNRIGERCREVGIKACYHNHAGTYIEKRAELDRLCELTDSQLLYLGIDTGHLVYGNTDPVDVVKKYHNRIKHLHIKDARKVIAEKVWNREKDWDYFVQNCGFMPVGLGDINFLELFEILDRADFSGWVSVEVDYSVINPYEVARVSREYLHNKIGI